MLRPITNTEPVDNEFSFGMELFISPACMKTTCSKVLRPKTSAVGITGQIFYGLLSGRYPLRGADPTSFQVLNFAYAMDKTAVYTTSGRIPNVDLAAFQVLDNGRNESGAPRAMQKTAGRSTSTMGTVG